jgi:DNA-binding transcriptional ArsR family regulator
MELNGTKKKSTRLLVLEGIRKGMYARQIAKDLGISEQRVGYHIRRLRQQGYVKRSCRTSYAENELTPQGRRYEYELREPSLPVRAAFKDSVCIHNLSLKFPILQDNPHAKFERSVQLNNWVKQYTTRDFPIGATFERTTKSIIADFKRFTTSLSMYDQEFLIWVSKGILWLNACMWNEYRIKIDAFNYEVLRRHLATDAPGYEDAVPSRVTAEVRFPRKATCLKKEMRQQAKAYIDRSLGKLEIETNDDTYEVNLIKMPERVAHIDAALVPVVDRLSNELRLHLEVLTGMRLSNKEIIELIRKALGQDEIKGTQISLA